MSTLIYSNRFGENYRIYGGEPALTGSPALSPQLGIN